MSFDPRKAAQIKRMRGVLDTVFQQDAAAYREDRAKIDALEAKISTLRDQLDPKTTQGLDEAEMIYWSKHRTWVKHTLQALNMDLARAYAEAEDRRLQLVQSNGRKQAFARITKP
jgi:hypothetical protein